MKDSKQKNNRSLFAFTSMMLGASAIFPFLGILTGILAVPFGIAGLIDISRHTKTGKIEAYIGMALGVGFSLLWIYLYYELESSLSGF